jgi:hypothetical protein
VEVGGLVLARHAEVRGDGRGELFASGGGAVARVFVVPGCDQRGLGVRQQSASDLMGILSGGLRSSTVILWSRLMSCGGVVAQESRDVR